MSNRQRHGDTSFQPVNPWRAVELAARKRNLPHLQTAQATYFVTFRCRPQVELSPAARDLVLSAICYWNGRRIELDAAVVMPDHAHAIFRVLDGSDLSAILHSIKSFSASAVNRLEGRSQSLWLDESFDHIIRHEAAWAEKIAYVRSNPIKRGLVRDWQDYPWTWPKE